MKPEAVYKRMKETGDYHNHKSREYYAEIQEMWDKVSPTEQEAFVETLVANSIDSLSNAGKLALLIPKRR